MTRDKIIRIALEAGLHAATDVNWMPVVQIEYLESFAKLVLMNTDPNSFMSYQEGAEAGRSTEREACAKLCEAIGEYGWQQYADAIRARGQA
jgi:hypothetical protein